jgi:putative Mg2+ transporter-C (MgtC) family protein
MPDISGWELLGRLAFAALLCGAIGLERETRGQAAGLRTYILVGVGSALFTLVSAYGFPDFFPPDLDKNIPRPDPTRIAAQIVTGIGFLGAGAIIRQGLIVRGLTTAAGLWIAAAIGMACGAGYYLGATLASALALAALWGLRAIRPLLIGELRPGLALLELELDADARLEPALGVLADADAHIEAIDTEREGRHRRCRLEVQVPSHTDIDSLVTTIGGFDGVRHARARGTAKDSSFGAD